MNAKEHCSQSRLQLARAFKEAKAGRTEAASEFGWCAAQDVLSAFAIERDRGYATRPELYELICLLSDETGREDLDFFLSAASNLKANAGDGFMPAIDVDDAIHDVGKLIEIVEGVLADGD